MRFKYLNNPINIFYNADDGSGGTGGDGSGGTGGDGAGDNKPASSFSGTLVEKTDPVSGTKIKVPVELEAYLGHIISSTRGSIEKQYKPMVEKLQGETAELADIRAEYQKLQEANMSAEEKATANAARKIAEHETAAKIANDTANEWKDLYMETRITNDILGSFGDTKLCNPEQTAILLQNEGKAEIVPILDDMGKPIPKAFQTKITLQLVNETSGELETIEGTPKELFSRWVNQDNNLHHLLNSMASGGSSSSGKGKGRGVDYMSMTAEERLNAARNK